MSDDEPTASERRIVQALSEAVAEIKLSARQEGDRVFREVEALLWLRDMLELKRPLPPTRGWAASPDLLVEVAKHIFDARPRSIVETGSGTSTIAMAACLRKNGMGHLTSLEHETAHANKTRAELERHGLAEWATVLDAPLGDVSVAGSDWRWYTVAKSDLPDGVEVVFVDGPPLATGPLARYPIVPFLGDKLSRSVVVFVDDGVRTDEREIVARWEREDPSFTARPIPSEKEAWILTRQR